MTILIQPHAQKPASVWNSGGKQYEGISRGIADSTEHCVLRLDPKPGERILDLGDGHRLDLTRCRKAVGVDLGADLVATLDEARRTELERDLIAVHDGFATDLGICAPREFRVTLSTRLLTAPAGVRLE